jgi:hypothetical protein
VKGRRKEKYDIDPGELSHQCERQRHPVLDYDRLLISLNESKPVLRQAIFPIYPIMLQHICTSSTTYSPSRSRKVTVLATPFSYVPLV